MPDLRNCRKCGKMFQHVDGIPVCQACKAEDEKDFERVREYLDENPKAPMNDVSSALEISIEKLKRYLKEGRLEVTEGDKSFVLNCESCGASIKKGRLCNGCSTSLSKDFDTTAKNISKPSTDDLTRNKVGMRHMERDKK